MPFICKAVNYGKDINIIGPKKFLYASSYPVDNVNYVCNAVSQCYHIPAIPVPSFMNLSLCPSNQIIHSGRVFGFFSKYPNEIAQELRLGDVPLLYEGLDDISAAEIQFLCDEIQLIKKAISLKYHSANLD